ncbi:MAG: tetratricopeptide repeat protein [Bacteroidia bacterium]|nr:tetratricopeptide repeat protein [Bacteroidia bacterium]
MKETIQTFIFSFFCLSVLLAQNLKTCGEQSAANQGTKHTEVLSKTDSLLNILKTTEYDTSKIKVLLELSGTISGTSLEKALIYAQRGLQLAEKIKNKTGIYSCYMSIGNILAAQGNNQKAMECLTKALKIYEAPDNSQNKAAWKDNRKKIAFCYSSIGTVYWQQGNFDSAIESFFKSLKIYEKLWLLSKYWLIFIYTVILLPYQGQVHM